MKHKINKINKVHANLEQAPVVRDLFDESDEDDLFGSIQPKDTIPAAVEEKSAKILHHQIIDTQGIESKQSQHKNTPGSMVKYDASLKELWQCPKCTFHNNMLMEYCELCQERRPKRPEIHVQVNCILFSFICVASKF